MALQSTINHGTIPTFTNLGDGDNGIYISDEYQHFIDVICSNEDVDVIFDNLNNGYSEEVWNGITDKYNNVNLFYVAFGIVKLYYYIKNIQTDITTFDEFIKEYDYYGALSKLKCANIDVRKYITKLNI